jgi:hypothetical protein
MDGASTEAGMPPFAAAAFRPFVAERFRLVLALPFVFAFFFIACPLRSGVGR